MGAEGGEGEALIKFGNAEGEEVGWAVEEVRGGLEQGAKGGEEVEGRDGEAFEMEVMINLGDQGRGAFAGMEQEDANLKLFREATQDREKFAVIAFEEGAEGSEVINDQEAGIGIAAQPIAKVVQTLGGGKGFPGIGDVEVGEWGEIGVSDSEARIYLL
ncbi:hypothetical protein KSC_083240 [Ktedonobacter sp. SOSP1-52]|nr:hypothetical protein KSC_083240 [Ktedonobacter sp. SOSP1-52]